MTEVPKGDFASGERTTPTIPKVEDFTSGEQTLPTAVKAVEDFASGEQTLPGTPENPDLAPTIPPILLSVVPDQRA